MQCECQTDGFCKRYGRDMAGRLREICRGENVDAGVAAQYRTLWESQKTDAAIGACPHRGDEIAGKTRECAGCKGNVRLKLFACNHPARRPDEVAMQDCQQCVYRPRDTSKARPLILTNRLSPGDVAVMTAAVYSLHRAHPGKFLTAVDTTAGELWEHNPDVTPLAEAHERGSEPLEMHYPAVHNSNQRGIHFMQGYTEHLTEALGVSVPLLTNRPRIYVSKEEAAWLPQVQEITQRPTRYWLVNAGRKGDYTTKYWGVENFQRVVDLLRGRILFVQVGSLEHHHPPLRNVINLVGKTDHRQFIRLVYHADGALGGVSYLQHVAAGLEKPCVCIMGGREPVAWNSYPRQQLLHTVGALKCCDEAIRGEGCWKSRVVPLKDGDDKDTSLCTMPVWGDEPISKCMAIIRPEAVVEAILRYES